MRCSRRSDKSQALIMEGNSGPACTHKGCTHHTQSCSSPPLPPREEHTLQLPLFFTLRPFRPFSFCLSASLTLPSFRPLSLVTRLSPSFPSLAHRPGFDPVPFQCSSAVGLNSPVSGSPCPVTDGHQAAETKSL